MTPKERAVAAFNFTAPNDMVPTFELQFQLSEELLGKRHLFDPDFDQAASADEREKLIKQNAELYVEEAEALDYSIVCVSYGPGRQDYLFETVKHIKSLVGDTRLIAIMADGTMAIPNGHDMMGLVERMAEKPEELHAELSGWIDGTLTHAKVMVDAGADAALMCADYCFNAGPFLSPTMFREWVTPYLSRSVAGLRELGYYTIKHTDGDIMPIIDQLVEANPHALHSLDPQARVDLKKVKELYGERIALCGNVHCGMLHNGTIPQIIEDSKRALRDGMPGGGYFFCSSNTPFKGMPLENYLAMLDVRKEHGCYSK